RPKPTLKADANTSRIDTRTASNNGRKGDVRRVPVAKIPKPGLLDGRLLHHPPLRNPNRRPRGGTALSQHVNHQFVGYEVLPQPQTSNPGKPGCSMSLASSLDFGLFRDPFGRPGPRRGGITSASSIGRSAAICFGTASITFPSRQPSLPGTGFTDPP